MTATSLLRRLRFSQVQKCLQTITPIVKEKYMLSISKHELSQLMCVKGCLTYVSRNARLEQTRITESSRNIGQTSKYTFEVSSKLRINFEVHPSKFLRSLFETSSKFGRNFESLIFTF